MTKTIKMLEDALIYKTYKNNTLTFLSHGELELEVERKSVALATSAEPQHNLSPYIKAFDRSIIPRHIRYCTSKIVLVKQKWYIPDNNAHPKANLVL